MESVTCPTCGKTARVPDDHASKRAICPNCFASFPLWEEPIDRTVAFKELGLDLTEPPVAVASKEEPRKGWETWHLLVAIVVTATISSIATSAGVEASYRANIERLNASHAYKANQEHVRVIEVIKDTAVTNYRWGRRDERQESNAKSK